MIYGYARCSTNDSKQDIRRQIRELKAAGAEEVVFEYEHGDARIKKELQMLLDTAREGDSIITLEEMCIRDSCSTGMPRPASDGMPVSKSFAWDYKIPALRTAAS